MEYPEHMKLKAVQEKSQAIGEFLEWLSSEKQIHMAKWLDVEYTDIDPFSDKETKYTVNELVIQPLNINEILAEYYGIDLKKIEAEKCAMLDSLRQNQSKS